MGSIQSDFLTEYLQYPPAPQTALGAALSLNRYPIWKMNIWAHSSHALHQYLKQHNLTKIHIQLDMEDILNGNAVSDDQTLVNSQLRVNNAALEIMRLVDILQLARMSLNGVDVEYDFLIDMREDGTLIIFGHRAGFDILKMCDVIGFDQLCRVCPRLGRHKIYEQSWIIHGLFETDSVDLMDENYPGFLALMIDHTKESYSVRLMGDFALAEHKMFIESRHVDVKRDDACGWHFINAISEQMKKRMIIKIYFKCDEFRMYIRIFIALRGIHLDCIEMACDLIRDKAWTGIPGTDNRNAFRVLYDEYLIPTWRNRFGLQLLNCHGHLVMDNGFSEGWNRKTLLDLGIGSSWFDFLWSLKRYFAVITSKYRAFEDNKFRFTRQRSSARKDRCRALKNIWSVFDRLDRSKPDIVWQYLEALYLCWEDVYDALQQKLISLS
eukprot:287303_1